MKIKEQRFEFLNPDKYLLQKSILLQVDDYCRFVNQKIPLSVPETTYGGLGYVDSIPELSSVNYFATLKLSESRYPTERVNRMMECIYNQSQSHWTSLKISTLCFEWKRFLFYVSVCYIFKMAQ